MDHNLPNCPTCDTPVHRADAMGGFVQYACDNESCEHFPATAFHPTEQEARDEWIEIVKANQPEPAAP